MKLMETSAKGIALIRQFEGCKLTAYKPVPGEKYWTIGIGHYGADVKQGQTITQAQAEALLVKDIKPIEQMLNKMNVNFRQSQFDALISWIFNLGAGNFNNSTLKKYIIQRRQDELITDQLVKWVNSCGKPLLGLKKRRVAEANLWLGREAYKIVGSDNRIVRIN